MSPSRKRLIERSARIGEGCAAAFGTAGRLTIKTVTFLADGQSQNMQQWGAVANFSRRGVRACLRGVVSLANAMSHTPRPPAG